MREVKSSVLKADSMFIRSLNLYGNILEQFWENLFEDSSKIGERFDRGKNNFRI